MNNLIVSPEILQMINFNILKAGLRNNRLIAISHTNKNYFMISPKYSLSRTINEYADKLDYFCGSPSCFKLNSKKIFNVN